MEGLLAKIYHSVISNESAGHNLGKKYDDKIQMIIAQYKEKCQKMKQIDYKKYYMIWRI